jgi:ATP-binding cassette subfamily B protein
MDCGPTCLRMIAKYYGKTYSLQTLREEAFITREGVSLMGISDAAEKIGFRTTGYRLSFNKFAEEMSFPCILHWNQGHFVVCYGVRTKRAGLLRSARNDKYAIQIADPAKGRYTLNEEEFCRQWISSKTEGYDTGIVLTLEPTPDFYAGRNVAHNVSTNRGLLFFFRYLQPHKFQLLQLIAGMGIGSVLQLIFPFLTQAVVDQGIGNHNLSFITLVLVAQLVLFATQLAVEFIRNWISLHVSVRINISLISDFLIKLMKLPLRFFDSKNIGDILQRIGDHHRIESFLTGSTLNTLFSFANFIVFAFILAYYNLTILLIFLLGNTLYVLWILAFMRYRRNLDYKRFSQSAGEQAALIQMITGMQEIKLHNVEKQHRWKWERIQIKLFKISIKSLALGQYQQSGSVFLSQTTGLFISFLSAKLVIDGQLTLGMMMSVSYIIGQLSGPISQVISFAQSLQDAKISLERLNEIHNKQDEEQATALQINYIPENKTIAIKNVSFSYSGSPRDYVLHNLNLEIPANKVTAIVGASGSGKTTILKLLLGFYSPRQGEIRIGDTLLSEINPHVWRERTGAVLQDGFIFSDTIANNIVMDESSVDKKQLFHAVEMANIREYIEGLPLKYNTKIGMEGNGLSQGQRQRLLLARAIYKNPDFIFLDEATNALDANNERIILNNLEQFYQGKTVIIVAHRLSTVQNADNIIVLDKGRVIEQGTHHELTLRKGAYYTLIKNQLEMGN